MAIDNNKPLTSLWQISLTSCKWKTLARNCERERERKREREKERERGNTKDDICISQVDSQFCKGNTYHEKIEPYLLHDIRGWFEDNGEGQC